MEILVEDPYGLPENSIVSIRYGSTRRQAPLDTVKAHPLKFPASKEACSEPLKIDVLAPVASARLVLHPNECHYRLGLDTKDKNTMAIGLNIGANIAKKSTDGQAQSSAVSAPVSAKYQDAAASAREYLETHGLLRYVQALLHAVIQVRPEDPFKFMVEQLTAPRCAGSPRPNTPWISNQDSNAMDFIAAGMKEFTPPSPSPPQVSPFPPQATPLSPPPPREAPAALPVKVEESAVNDKARQLEESREKMKGFLTAACESGDLQDVLANVLPKVRQETNAGKDDLEVLRTSMKQTLSEASASGRLAQALGKKSDKKASNTQAEDLRLQMRSVLQNASESGQLKEAVGKITGNKEKTDDVEQMRVKMRSMLEKQARNSVDNIRSQMFSALVGAADHGNLEDALDAVASGNKTSNQSAADDLRNKMRSFLEKSCESGQLEHALAKVAAAVDKKETMPNSSQQMTQAKHEELRRHLQATLEQACDSGELKKALVKELQVLPAGERLRLQMKQTLLTGCESGSLEKALLAAGKQRNEFASEASSVGKQRPETRDALRSHLKELLETKCASGELEVALGTVRKDGNSTDADYLKSRMSNMLETKCNAPRSLGRPEVTLGNGKTSKQDAHHLSNLRLSMRNVLEDAVTSGDLRKALATLGERKEVLPLGPPPTPPPTPSSTLPAKPMPPANAKTSRSQRPMSAVIRQEPSTLMEGVQEKPQRPLSAGSTQKLDCLSKDVFLVKENQESLHRVVHQLSHEMEQLKNENKSLMEALQRRNGNL